MNIEIEYYRLSLDKTMGDGKLIPQDQSLILIKRDADGLMFFETYGDDSKNLFWAKDEEVEFIEKSSEDWSEEKINERNRYINGEFL